MNNVFFFYCNKRIGLVKVSTLFFGPPHIFKQISNENFMKDVWILITIPVSNLSNVLQK